MTIDCVISNITDGASYGAVLKSEDVDFIFREVRPVYGSINSGDVLELKFIAATSPKFGSCFLLKSIQRNGEEYENVTGEVLENRRILIHKGNYLEDSAGCFLPGRYTSAGGRPKVVNSGASLDKLLDNEEIILRVTGNFKEL